MNQAPTITDLMFLFAIVATITKVAYWPWRIWIKTIAAHFFDIETDDIATPASR